MSYRLYRHIVVGGTLPEVFEEGKPFAVERQLNAIFDYRAAQIKRRFPSSSAKAAHLVHS